MRFLSFWNTFLNNMTSRCIVAGCSFKADKNIGISIHISPREKISYDKWAKFVSSRRAYWKPEGKLFGICSNHFKKECFQRTVHIPGQLRKLKKGSVPTIWKEEEENMTNRGRRQVSRARENLIFVKDARA